MKMKIETGFYSSDLFAEHGLCDEDASASNYQELLRQRLAEAYPHAVIVVRRVDGVTGSTSYDTRTHVECEPSDGLAEAEIELEVEVDEIAAAIYEQGSWQVARESDFTCRACGANDDNHI